MKRLEVSAERTLFISRAGADADFAAEIGRILEAAGYVVILQQWDFANRNFIERIHESLAGGARVVALLSPDYLRTDYCAAEWQNAIAGDPLNTKSRLILLRVVECEPLGLLAGIAYWDLVPIRDQRMPLEDVVRNAVREGRRDTVPIAGPYWRAPRSIIDAEAIRPAPSFTGREEEFGALDAALEGICGTAVLHGLGGTGKSALAREYAWRYRDRYAVVWWLNAEAESGIIEGLLRLGALFVRGLDQLADRRAAAQQVTGAVLSGFAKPLLLVFDNLEDESLLRTWSPRSGARLLVTSRNAVWGRDVAAIGLQTWTLDDAISYLQRESARSDLSDADAGAIAEALGGLPLALAHAAASLRGMRMVTARRYLDRIADHLASAPRRAEYPRSVFATFQAAMVEAEQQAPGAAAILCLAAWFAPDGIPDELFRGAVDLYPDGLQPVLPEGVSALDLHAALADGMRVDEALGTLDRLSLMAFSATARTYSMHRLVQLAGRDLIGENTLAWIESVVATAELTFPVVEFATWAQCDRFLPHARAALDALPTDTISVVAARLADRCGAYARERGALAEADALCARALAIWEKALGPDHPDVATSLNGVANVSYDQGRYAEAEPLYARTLAIREKALGPNHLDVARSLNNLANLYADQGRYAEAEPRHARALAIREAALGPDHPLIATSLNNLAILYECQGRYTDAELLHERALAIWEKALGPDHPDVARSLNNIADLYANQRRLDEAEPVHARALAIREAALGPDHPEVATSLNNLANLHVKQGRYADAERLHGRALAIWEKALGPDHDYVAESLNDFGDLYFAQERYAEAERLYTRSLASLEKVLGPDHPRVATCLHNIALLYVKQGRSAEAEPLFARALSIYEKAVGPEHPSTKSARASVAVAAPEQSDDRPA